MKKIEVMMISDKNLCIGTKTLKIRDQTIEQTSSNCTQKYFFVQNDKLS